MIEFIKLAVSKDEDMLKWFRVANNMIGFAAGVSRLGSLPDNLDEFIILVEDFEVVLTSAFDLSKLKLGQTRRKLVSELVLKYKEYAAMDQRDRKSVV